MLDADFIRENADLVKANCKNRGASEVPVDRVVAFETKRKELAQKRGETAAKKNEISKQFPQAKTPEAKQALKDQAAAIDAEVGVLDAELKLIEGDLLANLYLIPNMTHPDAPVGGDATTNKVVAQFGEPRTFDFKPKDHVALCEALDLADFEAGTKVAGQKFYFLKNEAVLLELALVQYAMQTLVKEGYTPVITPDLARVEVLEGIGFMPRDPNPETRQVYTVADTDLCLIATAEITLGGMHRDQIFDEAELPMQVRRPVALLPHRGRGRRPRHPRAVPRPPVHQGRDVRLLHAGAERGDPPGDPAPSRRRSSRAWGCRTTSSTPAPATWAGRRTASTTSKRGCPAAARAASTAR